MIRRLTLSLVLFAIALFGILPQLWKVRAVSGLIRDTTGQVLAGATVRIKTTVYATLTDDEGRFQLSGFSPTFRVRLTAWKDGYYVGGADAFPWDTSIEIELSAYTVQDNPEYSWILPAVMTRSATEEWLAQSALSMAAQVSFDRLLLPLASRLTLGCRDCHSETIFDQWADSSHSQGVSNPRFMSMYNGTDLQGNQSPPTRTGYNRDYGNFPLGPDITQPYYGPGYKLDFPDTAGNCSTCHLPTAALKDPYGTDPNQVTGVDEQGIHCDFCHKIAAIDLNPDTGRPNENMPGIMSIELMRPDPEPQLFFGPYDDVDVGPDTYLPLVKQSEICASCHNASFWGVPIYQSFSEWQASPYPALGETCQSCHMEPDGVMTNFAPGRGGLERDPDTIPTHNFPGASDEKLLQNAVSMSVDAWWEKGEIVIQVDIVNDNAGHHIPTDSPLRHMILLVQVSDSLGNRIVQLSGPTIQNWGGVGDPSQGYYAGLPGRTYAKVLQEFWTEIYPTGAYWNPTRILSDNRIPAGESDTTNYTFRAPNDGAVNIEVKLIFRRAFIELMDQKGWDVDDILMAQQTFSYTDEE